MGNNMKIKLSKSQWQFIGKKAGWFSLAEANEIGYMAPTDDYRRLMDSLSPDNSAKIGPVIHIVERDGKFVPLSEFDKEKLDSIFGKHEFNRFCGKDLQKRLLEFGYEMLINGKGVNYYYEKKS